MNELYDDLRAVVLRNYDLAPPVIPFRLPQAGVNNTCVALRTAAGSFVAKIYTSYDQRGSIDYEHQLLVWLSEQRLSFAVPAPLATRDGTLVCEHEQGWLALLPLLPGSSPEFRLLHGRQQPPALLQAELLGAALGELQTTLAGYPPLARPGRALFQLLLDFPPPRRDPLTLAPGQLGLPDSPPYSSLLGWWHAAAQQLQAFVAGPYQALPRQLCHNDFAPANVLFHAGRVSAVLDFEFATLAPRALDLAMALRMTMQIELGNPEPWELARHCCRGYARWIRLTEVEALALPQLLRLRTAIPFLWSLRQPHGSFADSLPRHIGKLQALSHWLEQHEQRLVELLLRHSTHKT